MRLFLGVDGGQSGTTAVIGDERGVILGHGAGGPCNHAAAGEGRLKLERAVSQSLAEAARNAALDTASLYFEAACVGMSGGPDDKRSILQAMLPAASLTVTHDADIALSGAIPAGQGIVVIAGTGSMAFARSASSTHPAGSQTARAGGWGYIFGDEGGAFDIVRQALRAALRMEEGWGPSTALRQLLLQAAAPALTINELLHLFYTPAWPRSRVAALAPVVDAAAGEGDPVARKLLELAAQDLALLAASVRSQLWNPGDSVDVSYVGGVFRNDPLRERFRMLIEIEEGNRCRPPVYGPAQGALLMAMRAAGLHPDALATRQ